MTISRKYVLVAAVGAAVIVIGSVCAAYVVARSSGGAPKEGGYAADQEGADTETAVVAIQPRRDAALVLSVRQLLSVEPFVQADLRSLVPGVVRYVQKEISDPVKRGEVLIAIDVPDKQQDLEEKEAAVRQRAQDVQVARAMADNARAAVEVYREIIELRRAEYGQAEATRTYRQKRYGRFVKMGKGGAIDDGIIEEEERDYRAAEFALQGAAAATRRAIADWREKESLVRTADADIELKQDLVDVARKNRDLARAFVNFARITAPFDGVVVKRNVDIGTFVQNGSTGQSAPLMNVARTDVVTVVMKVPDNAAPYVTRDTEAIIQIDELPGVTMEGKVTRFSPSIQNSDRTMRVEVDLYNEGPKEYPRFVARELASRLGGLAANSPLGLAGLLAASREVWNRDLKSDNDPLPTLPVVSGQALPPKLIPGMSGYMRLNLRSFSDAYLIPSSAVFTQGGKPYLLAVKDGTTRLLPVRPQYNDGKLAKVSVMVRDEEPSKGLPEVLRDLTADDVIILNRQAEIGEGKSVKVTLEKW